ncbi:MAG: ATP synthase F1 subunit delta [Polyangia bacterium]|jgi:F-type H+-transporting ATPase subunit delta|nr:ATP synthase F1 subunit delta [Polyangia bacterium]
MRREPEAIRVYSQSMLEAVKPTGQIQQYVDDAERLRQWYVEQKRLRTVLEGPHIPERLKFSLVDKLFGGGRLPPLLYNLVRVLIDKKRILVLPEILTEFRLIGEEELGKLVATVTTAVPMDASSQRLLGQKLEMVTGNRFTVDFRVDPKVLGGVLVKYKDVIIDGTLRGRLRVLRARLEAVA